MGFWGDPQTTHDDVPGISFPPTHTHLKGGEPIFPSSTAGSYASMATSHGGRSLGSAMSLESQLEGASLAHDGNGG